MIFRQIRSTGNANMAVFRSTGNANMAVFRSTAGGVRKGSGGGTRGEVKIFICQITPQGRPSGPE